MIDGSAPTAPTNLSGSAGRREITLTWSPSSDDVGVTGYVVSRNGARIATVTTTSYGDRSLTAGETYSYTVQAFDVAGNYSPASNTVTLTVRKNNRRR